jgi:hypothetical protein
MVIQAMLYLTTKAAISGILIAVASEVARRWPGWGALIVSLPLVSILAMLWLWRDTHNPARMADHVYATFWFVIPSLPMFLLIPCMLRQGYSFWTALFAGCALTVILYFCMIWMGPRIGIRL